MDYAYYPGCSLTGSARKLDVTLKKVFKKLGHTLTEIPEWNCCGAFEYGDRDELKGFSRLNLKKTDGLSKEIIAPCPACYKNLKETNDEEGNPYSIIHPLDIFEDFDVSSINAGKDLKGKIFTPYYGCVLLRPKETAIKNKDIMEKVITHFGGDVDNEKIKDRCCGGNQFFINKWVTKRLSEAIIEKSRGIITIFCPLCHMSLKTFSGNRRVIYFTDLLLYIMGEKGQI